MYLQFPRQLHLELTNRCNASCPMCSRTIVPVTENNNLSLDLVRQSIDSSSFKLINYCGNDGDPLMASDLVPIINYFAPTLQYIHTNGSLRSKKFWINLAKIPNLIVIFAIDGACAESHEKYRVNTKFKKILNNAKIFNEAGGTSWWQFIVFEHNQHEIEQAKNIAKELGFANFELLYSRREDIGDIKVVRFISRKADFECKSVKRSEIYIRSDGEVFPCVYHGDRNNTSGLNIKHQSLRDIVYNTYFDKFTFDNNTCQINCNSTHKNFRESFNLL